MYHLNLSLKKVHDEAANSQKHIKVLENEVNKKDFHMQELQNEITQLKNKIIENENMILHRNTEEVKRLNQEIKNMETTREYEENRLKTLVKSFESKVDQLTKENYALNEKYAWVSTDDVKNYYRDKKFGILGIYLIWMWR